MTANCWSGILLSLKIKDEERRQRHKIMHHDANKKSANCAIASSPVFFFFCKISFSLLTISDSKSILRQLGSHVISTLVTRPSRGIEPNRK